jgi:hypothetical protein
MTDPVLLLLELRAALPYAAHPPDFAADFVAGDEELFLFDESMIEFDPDEGPRFRGALPPPIFSGRPEYPGRPGTADPAGGEEKYDLEARSYIFMQFGPDSSRATHHDMQMWIGESAEIFARQAWWEGKAGFGPFIVRRLAEEEGIALQVLRTAIPQ